VHGYGIYVKAKPATEAISEILSECRDSGTIVVAVARESVAFNESLVAVHLASFGMVNYGIIML
jgi:uncharacterized protein with PhoU and TrkA domain